MASLAACILLLSSLFTQSEASLVPQKKRGISSASLLIVTATTGDHPIVTFYPSRVQDSSLWTLTAPTIISSTELVGPQGYEWVASPVPTFQPPAIPADAPEPIPPNRTPTSSPGSSSIPRPFRSGSTSVPGSSRPVPSSRPSVSPSRTPGAGSSSIPGASSSPTTSRTPGASPSSSTSPRGGGSSFSSASVSVPASAPFSGSWTATPTLPTETFPTYQAPTSTITGAAATSQAAQLSLLFFAVYADRQYITDAVLKTDYIKSVKRAQDETLALFNDLADKPSPDPACFRTSGSGSLISGLTDLIRDTAKLLSCATKVISNLVDAVEAEDPPIPEIEVLTDTLNEIAQDLESDEKDQSSTATTATTTATTSPTSCTSSAIVPQCTETISLSTVFYSAATVSSTVKTITTTVCTTVTACQASATTVTTIVSTATTSAGIVCATNCAACANPTLKKRAVASLETAGKRSLEDPSDFDSLNMYVMEQIETFPGVKELEHRQTGKLSSALSSPFLASPQRIYVAGLFGCTSVVIISEAGVWFSHFWEAPSFEGSDAQFQSQVIDSITNGDGVRMPSPFPLAGEEQILNLASNVQIYISTPKDPNTGEFLFGDRVGLIESTLTGDGAPFQGVPVTTRGYLKPTSVREQQQFEKRANSKVLIEYDNNQEADPDQPPKPKQQAIYRVWLEQEFYQHEWDATPPQQNPSCAKSGNQKRGAGSCSQPAYSGSTSVRSARSTTTPGHSSVPSHSSSVRSRTSTTPVSSPSVPSRSSSVRSGTSTTPVSSPSVPSRSSSVRSGTSITPVGSSSAPTRSSTHQGKSTTTPSSSSSPLARSTTTPSNSSIPPPSSSSRPVRSTTTTPSMTTRPSPTPTIPTSSTSVSTLSPTSSPSSSAAVSSQRRRRTWQGVPHRPRE